MDKEIAKIRSKIKNTKNLTSYTEEELKYISKPLGKAIFRSEIETNEDEDQPVEKKKAHWNDKVECSICGKIFTRSGRTRHKQTQYHMLHEKMNKKIKNLLIN